MKKWILTVCALAMVLGTMATPAHAARMVCKRGNAACGNQIVGHNFQDADNDGICDNKKPGNPCGNRVDADNDGICDNKQSCGKGRHFADTDNDGICDNRGDRESGGRGRHCGKNR